MADTFDRPPDPFPSGVIAAWDDDVTDIPAGWLLCDGNNGTLDLNSRYVKGVPDSNTDPGATGGQNSYNVTEANLPAHVHGGGTSNDGGHAHDIEMKDANMRETGTDTDKRTPRDGGSAGTVTTTSDGAHSHNHDDDTIGNDEPVDNQPPYRQHAYIKKS